MMTMMTMIVWIRVVPSLCYMCSCDVVNDDDKDDDDNNDGDDDNIDPRESTDSLYFFEKRIDARQKKHTFT